MRRRKTTLYEFWIILSNHYNNEIMRKEEIKKLKKQQRRLGKSLGRSGESNPVLAAQIKMEIAQIQSQIKQLENGSRKN